MKRPDGVPKAFSVDAFSGAATLDLPLACSAARGLEPQLSLDYSSRAPNGPCGQGFALALPSIARSTLAGVPRYDASDVFALAGAGMLVPLGDPTTVVLADGAHSVTRYAPRASSALDRIERWVRVADADTVWRHVDAAGVTSVFGLSLATRIADPADPARVFEWLLEWQYDTRGEAIAYEWLAEDTAGVDLWGSEQGRVQTAQRYLGAVRYAPQEAVTPPPYGLGPAAAVEWHVELLFDYGQYDPSPSNPDPYTPTGVWSARADPRSTHVPGFEVRTHRLLRNVLLFHRFDDLGVDPVLAHLTRLTYDENAVASRLVRYDSIGCALGPAGGDPYVVAPLPPLELSYSQLDLSALTFEELGADGVPPGVADAPLYAVADLGGEGSPGVVYADGESVRWWPPAAGGGPASGPPATPPSFPVERTVSDDGVQLLDLGGDGLEDLYVSGGPRTGAYPRDAGGFGPFVPFASVPTELGSNAALADLSGDGRPDALVLDRDDVRYYQGQGTAGFGAAVTRDAPLGAPASFEGGTVARVLFADVLGSGAAQLVRIANGSVECWPSLGYGVFGARVTLAGAPSFEDGFDPARVVLADLSGDGCADLLYIGSGSLLVHVNESGNGFADAVAVSLPVRLAAPARLTLTDLAGSGTPSIFVSDLGGVPRHWATTPALAAGLLTGLVNSLGAETEIAYTSAASCWRADAARGQPWIGQLPLALDVVAAVTERDALSDCSTTATYAYHDGFYAAPDRALGFAFVERLDAPLLDQQLADPDLPAAAPPRLVRTWFATGAFPDDAPALAANRFAGDPGAWELPGPSFDWGGAAPSDGETVRQAYAAQRGQVVREETYGLDGSAAAAVPYRVDQHAFGIRLVQARGAGPWAAFLVSEREQLRIDYERDPADPVARHRLTLEIDAYGHPLRVATVAYPRRQGQAGTLPEQLAMLVSCDCMRWANVDDDEDFRAGVAAEWIGHQLSDLAPPAGSCYRFGELATLVTAALAGTGAAVIGGRRSYYYAADGVTPAPLGACGPQALARTELTALIADTDVAGLFAPVLDAAALTAELKAGGHVLDATSGLWWSASAVMSYAPATSFHRPSVETEPGGATTSWTYDATWYALTETLAQAPSSVDQAMTIERFDYQALLPTRVSDANGKVTEALLDPLGQTVLRSFYGSELGQPVGFAPVLDDPWQAPASAAELIAAPETFLGDAQEVGFYDLLSYAGRVLASDLTPLPLDPAALLAALAAAGYVTPEGVILTDFRALTTAAQFVLPPPFNAQAAAIFAVLAAVPAGVPAHWVRVAAHDYPDATAGAPDIEVEYHDGFGRTLQRKRQVEPADGAERWATSNAVRYDAAGRVCATYPPSFSADWSCGGGDPDPEAATLYGFDAVNRPIRIDMPPGFFSTKTFSAWGLVEADQVDTVLESGYWAAHAAGAGIDAYELEALRHAALSAGTPTTYALDPLGNAIAKIELLNRTIRAGGFEQGLGVDPATAGLIYAELRANGMLDFRGALTTAFQPDEPGFSLGLSPGLASYDQPATVLLEGLLGGGDPLVTRYGRDLLGRMRWSADPRLVASWSGDEPGATSFATDYAFGGYVVHSLGADAGEQWRIPDVGANDRWLCDARRLVVQFTRDAYGRPLEVALTEPGAAAPRTVTAYRYGDQVVDGQPLVPGAAGSNLLGEAYRVFDGAGMRQLDGYSLGGAPMSISQHVLANPSVPVDWTAANAQPGSPALDTADWATTRRYDGRGLLAATTDPAGAAHSWTYTRTGWVGSVAMGLAGAVPTTYVSAIDYDPSGRRATVAYGNGAETTFAYDPLDGRMVAMATTAGTTTVQSLDYVYDPIGNVTHIGDGALAGLLGGLGSLSPARDYGYDSLYRLVTASGPELAALDAADEHEPGYDGLVTPATQPATALATAVRSHAYDAGGNLYWAERSAAGTSWTTETLVAPDSNRGAAAELCNLTPAPPGDAPPERPLPGVDEALLFDAAGNQLRFGAQQTASWDYADRVGATSVPGADVLLGYDSADRLAREVAQPAAGTTGATTDVLYLGAADVTRTTTPGEPTETFERIRVTDGAALVAEVLTDPAGGAPDVAYSVGDLASSVTLRLGADGTLRSYEAYTPYGATAFALMPDPAEAEAKLDRYDQRRRDRPTGLYDFGRRLFMPWAGRWLSPDPTGPVDGLNLYAFAEANPTSAIDVGGRMTIEIDGNVVDITEQQLVDVLQRAAVELEKRASKRKLPRTVLSEGYPAHRPKAPGDLIAVAATERKKLPEVSRIRVLSGPRIWTLYPLNEVGTHMTTLPGRQRPPAYDELSAANEPQAATHMIGVFKSKRVATGDPNEMLVPIMVVSESDRDLTGSMIGLMSLYLIKYGVLSFDEAFVNANAPYDIGARKRLKGQPGGAADLRIIGRLRAGEAVTLNPVTEERLGELLTMFTLALHGGRGDKPSKFAGLTSSEDVLRKLYATLLKRMQFPHDDDAPVPAALAARDEDPSDEEPRRGTKRPRDWELRPRRSERLKKAKK